MKKTLLTEFLKMKKKGLNTDNDNFKATFQEYDSEFQDLTEELLDDRLVTDQFTIEYYTIISEMRESFISSDSESEKSSSSSVSVFRSVSNNMRK
ncbi:hypothetical protein EMPG_12201 [Blastomyces silverae]|uniref:Uncharacterized protein n=1 Tax=Blastomyces silverae TaxID=2060906 RepID=A0A0H1BP03_9EURO|nr:hypothetical protein EMPG_12201 [Blastomyces silverae]